MIRIAIVDDDEYSIKICSDVINSMQLSGIEIVDTFRSGTIFLKEVLNKKVQYDIIILDIDMPGLSGFDVAEKLNEINDGTIIMFYTMHEQYVYKAFEYQPFRYIRKEFTNEELPFHLKCAIKKIDNDKKSYIDIKASGVDYKIAIPNIQYIQKFQNHIELCLSSGTTYEVRDTLVNIMKSLSGFSFVLANRSILVNMKYIENIAPFEMVLHNKEVIPISRRNYKMIRQEFYKYVGKLS